MATTNVVRARIDEQTKRDAEHALAAIGLTTSAAIRMLMTRIAAEQALPFDPKVPNATTVAAMQESRSGSLPRFSSTDELMADLNADD